jgi:hypothetical protein
MVCSIRLAPLWSGAPIAGQCGAVSGAGEYVVDIFDEVDEELRADRAQDLLKRYGGLIIAAACAVVLFAAGWQGWHWWQTKQDQAAASSFLAAMRLADALPPDSNAGQRAPAIADFQTLAAASPAGYRSLARLREAGLQADAGDLAGASAIWDQVAGDQTADPLLRDLAALISSLRLLDTADPALLAARLKPLTGADNPWRPLAEEQLALLDLRQGRTDQAKETLRRLAQDIAAPTGVRNRAGGLLARLGG